MKKVLFASTALVMTAGVAAAEVTVSGSANMGLKYNGTDTTVHNEVNFTLAGSGETEGGLSFGASADIEIDTDDASFGSASASDAEVFVSANGLTLTVGNIGEASDQGGLADAGYDGIGLDDAAEIGSFGAHDVRVDYAFGDVSVAASLNSSNSDWGIGGSASFDAFTVAVGFGETGSAQQSTVTLGYSAGAIGGKVYFVDNGTNNGQGIEVSYTSGDVTVTAVYGDNNQAGTRDAFGVGVAYDLGGATLAGAIGQRPNAGFTGHDTVADLGISFSF